MNVSSNRLTPSRAYTEVFGWGSDSSGQLGLGTNEKGKCYCIPRIYTFNVIVKQVASGSEHSAFITKDGFIFTVGSNLEGRLGINDKMVRMTTAPRLVESLSKFVAVQVSCGQEHTATVLANGEVYAWGAGKCGALGNGELKSQWKPSKMRFHGQREPKIKHVSCGGWHTGMVDFVGNVFMCGLNDCGQLGTNSTRAEAAPAYVEGLGEKMQMVACGDLHSLALAETGRVFAAGFNDRGQLGTGTKRSSLIFVPVKKLAKERAVKIAASNISACLTSSGLVFTWGLDSLTPTPLNGTNKPVREMSVGTSFGVFIDAEGGVYSWGNNRTGELGTGDYKSRHMPTAVPTLIGRKAIEVSCGPSHVIVLSETIIPNVKEPITNKASKAVQRARSAPRTSHEKPLKETMNAKANLEYLRYKNTNIMRKIQEERERAELLAGNCDSMQQSIARLKEQMHLLQSKKHKRTASLQDNMDKSLLLRDYESRMVREIKESQSLERERVTAIRKLNDEIRSLENLSVSLQQSNTEILSRYTNELVVLEDRMNKCRVTLKERRDQNEPYSTSKTEPYDSLIEAFIDVRNRENEAAKLESQVQLLRGQAGDVDRELSVMSANQCRLKEELQLRYSEICPELAKLQEALDDKVKSNRELRQRLVVKEAETDSLSKEVSSWSQVSDNLRGENTQLKKQIEQLEARNRKILEGMNSHMYARAAEYKERTLRALSHSPFRGRRQLGTSVSTEKGVKEIARMTRFAADTVKSIKNRAEGTSSPPRSKDEFNPDYVVDKNVYKIEEDPKYVKSNYQLIQILDQYNPRKEIGFSVEREEEKIRVTKSDYVTPIKIQDNEILKSAQKLVKAVMGEEGSAQTVV
eukprot:TRINITY_DN10413_c0_g1_i1.p1 TRINITY_DN10413_c0_g1~~TRINITY_DN10413_c0_g1_i1.p1  ORF type:complete len:863 (-),score=245.69 TRINITY_DN10413_c0_g1_i1:255-2843(-)